MFKRVDIPEDAIYDGCSFVDDDGQEYGVLFPDQGYISLRLDGRDVMDMYHKDIPQLIKALQEVYNYKE